MGAVSRGTRSRAVAVAAPLAAVALGLAALAGCDSGTDSADGADGAARADNATAVAVPTPGPPTTAPGTSAARPATPAASGGPSAPSSLSSSATPHPVRTAAATIASCRNAPCEITVRAPATIALDPARFGFGQFRVTHIDPDDVTVEARTSGSYLRSDVGPGGTARLNGLVVHIVSVTGNTARLVVSPAR